MVEEKLVFEQAHQI